MMNLRGRLRSYVVLRQYAEMMQMSSNERRYLERAISRKRFLELGSGYSTLWLSRYAFRIVSVETRLSWFLRIRDHLSKYEIGNVDLRLLPPEPCAYLSDGREAWSNREIVEGSDYGSKEEFVGYLYGIQELLMEGKDRFDVILIDGNVRYWVVQSLRDLNYDARIFLHDVVPERAYLNDPILRIEGVTVVSKVDSLVELKVHSRI